VSKISSEQRCLTSSSVAHVSSWLVTVSTFVYLKRRLLLLHTQTLQCMHNFFTHSSPPSPSTSFLLRSFAEPDLIMCRKQPGISLGRLCEKCDGKCVICDSYVRPHTVVHICDECNYGAQAGRCVVCGGQGVSDAFYCKECVQQEKDVSAMV
jgi:hypothetical protein